MTNGNKNKTKTGNETLSGARKQKKGRTVSAGTVAPMGRAKGRGRLSAVIPRPVSAYIKQTRLPMPDLTHAMTDSEMTFLRRLLSPGSERTKFNADVRIPDGAVPNSAVIALREYLTIVCPFRNTTEGLITTSQWTLIYLRLPLLKLGAIFIALDQEGDISAAQELAVKNYLNLLPSAIPAYPSWADVQPGLKVCGTYWRQLDAISTNPYDETRLISQFRHCNHSTTMYFNTPDLVNQGMVVGGQWNLDIKPTALEPLEDLEEQTEISTSAAAEFSTTEPLTLLAAGISQSPNGEVLSGFRPWPLTGAPQTAVYTNIPGITGDATTYTAFVSAAFQLKLGQQGFVRAVGGTSAAVQNVNEYVHYYIFGPVVGTTRVMAYGIATYIANTGTTPATSVLDGTNGSGTSINVNLLNQVLLPIGLVWNLTQADPLRERYQIVLPPLSTKSIVQSTPKFVMYLMKTVGGWYQVNRVFQPVFNMQEGDTQRHIRFALAGSSGADTTEVTSIGGLVDTYDLNFSVGVTVMSGMSYSASPSFKFISDMEIVADEGSPWQTNMMETNAKSDQVIAVARTIMDSQPFLYPEYYNSMGTILGGLSSMLSGLPIISNVLPLVSKFMSSVMGTPTNEASSQGTHENVHEADVGSLVKALLSKLTSSMK